jgi:hypothetical protein
MSIKKLFESDNKSRNYLSDTTEKEAFQEVESADNVREIRKKQETFVPQIDYSNPANFAKFGSAYLYYKSAIERILDFYPYDGSDAELNGFYNKSLDIEKYIFNNLYPRTNGYIKIGSDGWGTLSGSLQSGYGLPSTLEYIDFKGGPNTISATKTAKLFKDPNSSNTEFANIYDDDIYVTAGLPAGYGSGSRESNLKADFDKGVTVEFWTQTGSLSTALTNKQVLVDIWNNELSCSAYGGTVKTNANPHYGRITIAFNGISAGSPFRITAQSGTAGNNGIFEQAIGNDIKVGTFDDWKHYAFVFYNTGSNFVTKLYVDGRINDTNTVNSITINELNSKNMVGRIGALLTAPSGNAGNAQQVENMVGAGKLSGSIDEFRYWKVARTGQDIGKNWFTQVRGGSNTDISNTTLGIYYKFNEGATGTSTTDQNILDYSGRLSNGTWNNYTANGRLSGSAIIEATASATEYKDAIIYSTHPEVSSLKKSLLESGSYHDTTNNSSFMDLVPEWIIQDVEEDQINDVKIISHIMGSYFDKIHMWISQIPSFKNDIYTSASYSPLPFAQHLPQSLGLYTPQLFVDSSIVERFLNRDEDSNFEGNLTETKNLIYLNLYNNLTNIFKAKGTEKAIRNVFRCFNIDERLIKLNTYSNNNVYTLTNNLQQILVNKSSLNFNNNTSKEGVVYQAHSASSTDSQGYISGSNDVGYEDKYGFTLETDIVFPRYFKNKDKFDRNFLEVSLFGAYTVDTGSSNSKTGDDTTWVSNYTTEGKQPDFANFQVTAVRDAAKSKNVYFKLTSSNYPYYIPQLTSSTFFSVYDQTKWNLSVRIKPSNFPVTDTVSGSSNSGYTYDLIFKGVNKELGTTRDSFTLTASLDKTVGQNVIRSSKRIYTGARRTNITGTILNQCDVLVGAIKYWSKYINDTDLEQHANDINNRGISGSYQNFGFLDSTIGNVDVNNLTALALDWNFDRVTSSNVDGTFYITDFSSGSATTRNNYSWVGDLTGYQHFGYGYGFITSSSDVVVKEAVNSYKFVDPEKVISSDMIQILTEDDVVYGMTDTIPSYKYTLEKSQYAAISEEMLQFFAGVADFHNVIGALVNRYRERYKDLEKLREIFFRRVTDVKEVEKFIDYYRWFDDSLSEIISQLLPASSDFTADAYNTIESHILERNKYKTQFPTLKLEATDPNAAMQGVYASTYPYVEGSTPLPSSTRLTTKNRWYWDKRAERNSAEITSGDSTVDEQRNTIRDVVYRNPHLSQSMLRTYDGSKFYDGRSFTITRLAKNIAVTITKPFDSASLSLKGGVNFTDNKNIHFTYNALYPGGPVDAARTEEIIPDNVLVAFTEDMEKYHETVDLDDLKQKYKRVIKVHHGRDWQKGLGYSNVKSSYAFPFNIITPAVSSGYNHQVIDKATSSIQITNLHHDGYGDRMEIPMQGPFTDYAVGGHQSRHVGLNTGSDNYTNRPEAWKLLLGLNPGITGAIGMAGADYPWPEANEIDVFPYPMTASQKAVYYRDFIAKRPVNIRNIQMVTGSRLGSTASTIIGNYSNNYQLVHMVGAFANPRNFVDLSPTFPDELKGTQARSILGIRRDSGSHFEFMPEYSTSYLTGTTSNSIFIGRFSAPGGIEVMSKGYLDVRGSEYSVYNSLLNRNLTVIKPTQGPSDTTSMPVGSGTAGIRVSDIHDKDYGLRSHLSRHTAKFGRDSLFVTSSTNLPGRIYDQLPGFHKVHRNIKREIEITNEGSQDDIRTMAVASSSLYDNYFVQHAIPRSDRQYSWYTSSLIDPQAPRYFHYAPIQEDVAGYYSSSTGYVSFFDFITGSEITSSTLPTMYQPTNTLNIFVIDAISGAIDNIAGFTRTALETNAYKYFNADLINSLPTAVSSAATANEANYFNLLMAKRGNAYGWNWKSTHQGYNPILRAERKANEITINTSGSSLVRYTLKPVTIRGRPILVNFTAPTSNESDSEIQDNNLTLKITNNNERIYFSDTDLEDYVFSSNGSDTTVTPYDQILSLVTSSGYNLNWLAYTEGLFPSAKNEFSTASMERTDYDNKYWRATNAERVALGATVPNSFGIDRNLSQSSWPLDAPEDFVTRTQPPCGTIKNGFPSSIAFGVSSSAGELQNTYFSYYTGTLVKDSFGGATVGIDYNAPRMLRFGALYARKHMLSSRRSTVSPTGPDPLVAIGNQRWPSGDAGSDFLGAIAPYSGEAVWEAGPQAGIIVKTGSTLRFESHPSEPWFKDYDNFKEDVKLVAKGYSIIPEFRISEHVEDYTNNGISDSEKTDTFEIPGTIINSSTSSFYRDYSNSEFMTEFLNIKNDSLLNATEIRLICSAAIRFNPYKGFYPAQRTLDLVNQFSKSYGSSLMGTALKTSVSDGTIAAYPFPGLVQPQAAAGALRPLFQTLFAPGILYNSIKSGIAVDYPVLSDVTKRQRGRNYYGGSYGPTQGAADLDTWALSPAETGSAEYGGVGYNGGEYWDKRLAFETIMEPEKELNGLTILDCETHPSMSLRVTSSWTGQSSDGIYTLMAKNFFGEVAKFFLKDQSFTKLESNALTDGMTFDSGSWYGARLKLKRSSKGPRTYNFESGSDGTNQGYGRFGALGVRGSPTASTYPNRIHFVTGAAYPLPQDPRQNLDFRETFTMYSRPTAFGPSVGGRPTGSYATNTNHFGSFKQGTVACRPVDSFSGFNWSFTPPYYNGESWVDLIFKPGRQGTTSYDLETMLSEVETVYWRVDPGYAGMGIFPWGDGETPLLRSFIDYSGSSQPIYSGRNVNANAMQISASISIFGIEDLQEQELDSKGLIVQRNKIAGKKWIIQPKFETPMMNFTDVSGSLRPISVTAGTLTLPTGYGSASVSRGMWHQFGLLPQTPSEGVFMEIGDIPTSWLQYHYEVTNNDHPIYNDSDADGAGQKVYKKMKSLTDLVGFGDNEVRRRLGAVADEVILREAVVAVPYIVETISNSSIRGSGILGRNVTTTRKKFIDIPTDRYDAALAEEDGTISGDTLDTAGASIRKLVQKMERYILPPQFDFLNNQEVDPIVMYMFEFKYKLDKDDLAYIWQNLAPRNYKKITLRSQSIAHDLSINELLEEDNIMENDNLRWMVFKVKQRSQASYDDLTVSQVGASSNASDVLSAISSGRTAGPSSRGGSASTRTRTRSSALSGLDRLSAARATTTTDSGYEIGFNWPYDYVSFVEMVKIDAELLYEKVDETASQVADPLGSVIGSAEILTTGPTATPGSGRRGTKKS